VLNRLAADIAAAAASAIAESPAPATARSGGGAQPSHRAAPSLHAEIERALDNKGSLRSRIVQALSRAVDDLQRLPVLRLILQGGPRDWWALPLVLDSRCSAREWEDATLVRYAAEMHRAAVGASTEEGRQALGHALQSHPLLTGLVAMIAADSAGMLGAARRCSALERRQLSRIALSSVARDQGSPAAFLDLNLALWLAVLRDVELEAQVKSARDAAFAVQPSSGMRLRGDLYAEAKPSLKQRPHSARAPSSGVHYGAYAHGTRAGTDVRQNRLNGHVAHDDVRLDGHEDVAAAVAAEKAAAVPRTSQFISGGGSSPFALSSLQSHSAAAPRRIRMAQMSLNQVTHSPRPLVAPVPLSVPDAKTARRPAPPAPTKPVPPTFTKPIVPKVVVASGGQLTVVGSAGGVFVGAHPEFRHPLHDVW
jgi:hypothetical protein